MMNSQGKIAAIAAAVAIILNLILPMIVSMMPEMQLMYPIDQMVAMLREHGSMRVSTSIIVALLAFASTYAALMYPQ